MNMSIALSFMNSRSGHLFEQALQNLNQISSHILHSDERTLEDNEIRKIEVKKSMWSQPFLVSKKKEPPGQSSKSE